MSQAERIDRTEDPEPAAYEAGPNFIHDIIDEDRRVGKNGGRVHTRFPPEPNGYLHIGHAKSICLNFGTAQKYGGLCNLRFDDTNPATEDPEYVESIQADVRWLGFDWADRCFHASDYFDQLYAYAERLIGDDKAYAAIELLFSQQDKWAFVDKPLEPLIAAMRPAGLTHDQAMACLKDQVKANAIVAIGKRATEEIKMNGTPTFVIDGKVYGGELSIDQLKAILDPLIKK